MKKTTIKPLIFIISLLPLVCILVMSILKNENVWMNNFILATLILVVCVTYQIYYIMSLKAKKVGAAGVIFSVAIACWIVYLLEGVNAFFFGTAINEGGWFEREMVTYYGFEAMKYDMGFLGEFFSLYVPILPISLIYIIIYTIYKIKTKAGSM